MTKNFPGKEIVCKTHKVILAMSSSVFEQMLFGSMAIKGSELELPDNNPDAFKIVLAHCYEVSIEPSGIDESLEVYMLADKYFLEELKKECLNQIYSMLDSKNIVNVFEFSTAFNFDFLVNAFNDHVLHSSSSDILLVIQQEWLKIF